MKKVFLMQAFVVAAAMAFCAEQCQASLIVHFNGEDSGSPLTSQVGGYQATANGSGLSYLNASPAGGGNAYGATGTGRWAVDAAGNTALRLSNNFTVAAWINVSDIAGDTRRIIGQDQAFAGGLGGWSFGIRNRTTPNVSTNTLIVTATNIADYVAPNDVLELNGTWEHVAFSKSSTDGIRMYVNGNEVAHIAGATGNFIVNNNIYSVGRAFADNTQTWNGLLDEVRVYNTVLSQGDIALLATPVPEPAGISLVALLGVAMFRRYRSSNRGI